MQCHGTLDQGHRSRTLTWIMPPYVLYGVKYIGLVSVVATDKAVVSRTVCFNNGSQAILGSVHQDCIATRHNIAELLHAMGEHDAAVRTTSEL